MDSRGGKGLSKCQDLHVGDRTFERDKLAAQFARHYEAVKGDRLHAGDRA